MSLSLALNVFDQLGISIGNFVLELLTSIGHEHHPAVESIFDNLEKILEALIGHSDRAQKFINHWSSLNTVKILQDEMCRLTLKETGFHFSARTTTETKLKDFDIQVMSNKMQTLAPGLCTLFDVLLEANPALTHKRSWARRKAVIKRDMIFPFLRYLFRKVRLFTEITESKVCQPLYRELEPLDGVGLVYILIDVI
jgi:hypothetical protein